MYGPLDKNSQLRAGEKGMHVVTTHELDTMCRTIQREDILSVYAGQGLAPEEEEEILAQADSAMKFVEQYVEEDIERILRNVPRDEDDLMSFHDMQKAVYKARAKHTLMLKSAMDRLTKVKNKQAKTAPVQESVKLKKKPKAKVSSLVAPPNMFEKDSGMNDTETAMVVAKMLGKHSYKICQVETGNNPELTQNVKLLRADFRYGEVALFHFSITHLLLILCSSLLSRCTMHFRNKIPGTATAVFAARTVLPMSRAATQQATSRGIPSQCPCSAKAAAQHPAPAPALRHCHYLLNYHHITTYRKAVAVALSS
jgi:hypothetical protein